MQLFGPALTSFFPKWLTFGSLASSSHSSLLYRHSNMPSDLEMSDSSQSDGEPNTNVAYRRGPPHLMHKGNLYTRKEHQDNTRAYSKASIIWQFGDEYARTVNGQQKKYWRCGLRDRTTILVMSDNSSSGLRHLKKNHGIDKDRQRQTSQTTAFRFFNLGFLGKALTPHRTRFQSSAAPSPICRPPSLRTHSCFRLV